jgi:hypothetical protein
LYQSGPISRHWRNTSPQMVIEFYPHRLISVTEGLSRALG